MIQKLSTIAIAVSSAALALSPAANARTNATPHLIVAISVDQFSGDLFNEYRSHFSGGLKRLTSGVVFPRGYQSHAATETCPGHSTLLTGARPSRSGIIANNWFDQSALRDDKSIYCAEDETAPFSSSKQYVVSPRHLRVSTLGERLKLLNPASRNIAIAGKDRAAVMMGGRITDQIWWWDNTYFTSYKGVAATPLIARNNAAISARLAAPQPPLPLPAWCAAHDYPVQVNAGRTIGTGRFERAANDAKAFRASPAMDEATLTLAGALVTELKLGQGSATDVLSIGLSATDYIGHIYGTEGTETCIQVAALDQSLGTFFSLLDQSGVDYVIMLTADHGGHDAPERSAANGILDAARVDNALNPAGMNKRVAKETGLSGSLLLADGASGDWYLARNLSKSQRKKVLSAALDVWRSHPQVEAAFTRQQIAATPSPTGAPDSWTLLQMARASFDPARSGDILVLLKPRITPIADAGKGSVATHGSPWDYDRRVPILFWRKGMDSFEQPNSVETVDIMPTLAALIGVKVDPNDIDGRCLDLDPGEGTTCPAP
jgi:predicted AlkP superfamily pyrophosphatase or phosphodiesterase